MKSLLLLSLFSSLALASNARARDAAVLRTLKDTLPAGTRAVQVENDTGAVKIEAVNAGFGWEWTLRTPREATPRAEAYAQECRLEVRQTDGTVKLILIRPDAQRGHYTRSNSPLRRFLSWATLGAVRAEDEHVISDLTLRVPVTSVVAVTNAFGAVHVTGTSAAVAVEARNSRVELSNLEGTVTARTSFDRMAAHHIGSAQLKNQNGNIDVSDVAGELRATTSFARLQVRDVTGAATLRNQNGAIDAARIRGDMTAETSFSDLLVEGIDGRAELKAQNGRVEAKDVRSDVVATTTFGPLRVRGVGGNAMLHDRNGKIEAVRVTGNLKAETSFSELQVEDVGGKADLDCRNGRIEVARVSGDLRAVNSFGPLHVRDIAGAAVLEGQNSDVAAAGVKGDIRAQTSFGRMRLEGDGQHFDVHNQNGAVEIVARSPDVQRIEASASFAPIDVRLPGEAKPLIRAATSFGKVQSDFPVMRADTISDAKFAADTTPLKISLKGQNGDIRIQPIAVR
jgi:DUF4097 and DUF4098 domain-containing protein YvlB